MFGEKLILILFISLWIGDHEIDAVVSKCILTKSCGLDPKTDRSCKSNEIVGHTIETECQLNKNEVSCFDNITKGTLANSKCKLGYKPLQPPSLSTSVCEADGSWDRSAVKCLPECGLPSKRVAIPLLVGGVNTNITEVPWHVAFYDRDKYFCGGSIITERLVVSAAHCFFRDLPGTGVRLVSTANFVVVAGKYYRNINETEPLQTQRFGIEEVRGMDRYNGYAGKYVADIAVVALDHKFYFTDYISPICIDFNSDLSLEHPVGEIGKVAGWGWVEFDQSSKSDELKTLDLPVVSYKDCLKTAGTFESFVTADKLCVGASADGRGACRGDSGGGLAIPKTIGDIKAFYLRGVVSNTKFLESGAGGCDVNFPALFTNIHSYIGLIQKAMRDYKDK